MKFAELKKSVTNGVKPIYLVTGEDAFLREKSLEILKNAFLTFPEFNFDVFDAESLKEAPDNFYATVTAYPFMASYRFVILNEFYPTASDLKGKMLKSVFNGDNETTVLIIINSKKCANLEKIEKVTVVDCSKLDTPTIIKWIRQECVKQNVLIGSEASDLLCEFCLDDMTKISAETAKLISYVGKNGEITVEAVKELTTKDTEYQVYALTDKISQGKNKEALAILYDMLDKNTEKQKIFSAIYYHFRRLFYASISACDTRELAISLGADEWQIKKAKTQAKNFTPKRLKFIVDKLSALDGDFKSGEVSLDDALWNSIFNVMI